MARSPLAFCSSPQHVGCIWAHSAGGTPPPPCRGQQMSFPGKSGTENRGGPPAREGVGNRARGTCGGTSCTLGLGRVFFGWPPWGLPAPGADSVLR